MSSRIAMMGCQMDHLTMDETVQKVGSFVRDGAPHQHVVVSR